MSEPVARAMAEGALRASGGRGGGGGHRLLAGQAGPGEEPGLVHFAVAAAGAPTVHEEHHSGDVGRDPCRIERLRVALRMLKAAVTIR